MINRATRVMRFVSGGLLALTAFGVMGTVIAEEFPRSFVASPEIYKVVASIDQYKVIEITFKPGQRDHFHSHKMFVFYFLTDCALREIMPDGTFTVFPFIQAGTAATGQSAKLHSFENMGQSECKMLHFEQS